MTAPDEGRGGAAPARAAGTRTVEQIAVLGALVAGYIGIYLCRKNLAVAIPLLQAELGVDREQLGRLASTSTLAYALGKLAFGPVVDRIGGRAGFLGSLFLVAAFGAIGASAPGLGLLGLFYSLNRFTGAAAWGAMVSLVPTWVAPARRGTAMAVVSLSYVVGGALAMLLGRGILALGFGWRGVMGLPSLVLLAIALPCALLVRPGPLDDRVSLSRRADPAHPPAPRPTTLLDRVLPLLAQPQFLIVLALSFALTLMRESFNTWSVDFLSTLVPASPAERVARAALHSVGFDLAGAVSVLGMGVLYDRTHAGARRWLLAGLLGLLAVAIAFLPAAGRAGALWAALLIALVGLLVYGPYSLLSGVLALETGGAARAATAAGLVDAVGYLAGVLAGSALGYVLDVGGYPLGFCCLAILTIVSAAIALGLKPGATAARPPAG